MVLLGGFATVAYELTRPPAGAAPIELSITNGSVTDNIEGNLTTVGSNQTDLIINFTASTFAQTSNGSTSKLTLLLHTWTLYDSACGCVDVNVIATIVGSFVAALEPSDVSLVANQTGPNATLQSWAAYQAGTNVSFDPAQTVSLSGGSAALKATVIGEAGRPYNFSYANYFNMRAAPRYNRFLGFQAMVMGHFNPVVSVGILLKIINVPGGIWA